MTKCFYRVINGDGIEAMKSIRAECVFADPPDNIGLKYGGHKDNMAICAYESMMRRLLTQPMEMCHAAWISYNPRWFSLVGHLVHELENKLYPDHEWKFRNMIQTFTFGQHQQRDFGTNHRPLLRMIRDDTPIYAENIRVKSWRQEHGDKRAAPGGRVPGDVFDFPRVTGNSHQRRKWCPTQLHEGLVERCVLSSTQPGDCVYDPFGGTGTTLRVCKRIGRSCITAEIDPVSCEKIAEDNGVCEVEKA